MGLFPLEDVRTMVFELSLIRSAFFPVGICILKAYSIS